MAYCCTVSVRCLVDSQKRSRAGVRLSKQSPSAHKCLLECWSESVGLPIDSAEKCLRVLSEMRGTMPLLSLWLEREKRRLCAYLLGGVWRAFFGISFLSSASADESSLLLRTTPLPPHLPPPPVSRICAGCVMDMRHPDGARVKNVYLPRGSLLVMEGSARYEWSHGIASRKTDMVRLCTPCYTLVQLVFKQPVDGPLGLCILSQHSRQRAAQCLVA